MATRQVAVQQLSGSLVYVELPLEATAAELQRHLEASQASELLRRTCDATLLRGGRPLAPEAPLKDLRPGEALQVVYGVRRVTCSGHGAAAKAVELPGPEVAPEAFAHCATLASVLMPTAVAIGARAFLNCSQLLELQGLQPLARLGPGAFRGCASLTSIDLGRVPEVPEEAFQGCAALQQLRLPDSLQRIGRRAI